MLEWPWCYCSGVKFIGYWVWWAMYDYAACSCGVVFYFSMFSRSSWHLCICSVVLIVVRFLPDLPTINWAIWVFVPYFFWWVNIEILILFLKRFYIISIMFIVEKETHFYCNLLYHLLVSLSLLIHVPTLLPLGIEDLWNHIYYLSHTHMLFFFRYHIIIQVISLSPIYVYKANLFFLSNLDY
jgi:hypothetical protein